MQTLASSEIKAESDNSHQDEIKIPRWYLAYFLLATFNILTVVGGLWLISSMSAIFVGSVEMNQKWSIRAGNIANLRSLAGQVNAPGNDVFDSHDVEAESARLNRQLNLFLEKKAEIEKDIELSVSGINADILKRDLHDIHLAMDRMVAEAKQIFTFFRERKQQLAGARMATMDRQYAEVNDSFNKIGIDIRKIQENNFAAQLAEADLIRRFEIFLFGLVLLMVIGATLYGYKIYRNMYSSAVERQSMINRLRLAKKAAEKATAAKTQFLSTMSHEIRTPMNAVLGMAQLLEDTTLTYEQKEYLTAITRSGTNLLSIINDILDFSKLDSEKVEVESIPFDLERICQETMELVAGNAIDRDLEFVLDYHPDYPRYFEGDPTRIRQILINLLGNAVKFTNEGLVQLRVSWEPSVQHDSPLLIEVKDTGIGLKVESFDDLFEEFTQADRSTTRNYGGTGLGLAITKKLVDLLKWKVGVDSVYGEGSTFWIKGQLHPVEITPIKNATSLEGVRVLFVDDNKEHRRIFRHMLGHMGVDATVESDPMKVIQIVEEALIAGAPYRILILDQDMPVKSAYEIGLEIRENRQLNDLKLMVFSLAGQKGDVSRFKRAGFNAYLSKLCRYEILQTMLITMLEQEPGQEIITQHYIEDVKKVESSSRDTFEASVLLVEDVLPNQIIAQKFLKKMGVEVEIVSDGKQAVEAFAENAYDLIFMDCLMPEMDGFEATRIIRSMEKERHIAPVPIIALTASASREDRLLCEEAGMDDCIAKPFKAEDISKCLRQWL